MSVRKLTVLFEENAFFDSAKGQPALGDPTTVLLTNDAA
jgi:hypothetical protein